MDRLTRRVSVFEGPDCEKCIVLSREIGVVKYAALEFSRAKKDRAKILAGESGRGGGGVEREREKDSTGVVSAKDNLLTN